MYLLDYDEFNIYGDCLVECIETMFYLPEIIMENILDEIYED